MVDAASKPRYSVTMPTPPDPHFFTTFDGTRLAWREVGEGRPVVLIHGYFSDATTNWIRYGHAAAIAARGLPRHHARPARARRERQAA